MPGLTAGVFLSTNNGTSWTAVNTGLTNTNVRALAVSGTNLFAGTDGGGVFLSTNNGTSWTAVNTGLTNTNVYVSGRLRHESLCRDFRRRRLPVDQQRHKLDSGQYRLDEHRCLSALAVSRHESLCRDLAAASFSRPTTAQAGLRSILA
ncbi:MAG: hypothetical protein MZV64_69590 [Ignavibacteriales bacterium]|nr:hypothetical protein [Ignavibacteriales bacterium]